MVAKSLIVASVLLLALLAATATLVEAAPSPQVKRGVAALSRRFPARSRKPSPKPSPAEPQPSQPAQQAEPSGGGSNGAPTSPAPAGHSGDGTFYTPGLGSCGTTSSPSDLVAAISNPSCGTCARVCYQGKCTTVTVLDTCPSCGPDSIDLGESAFKQIADTNLGRIPVTWSVSAC